MSAAPIALNAGEPEDSGANWPRGPAKPVAVRDEVHLWRANLAAELPGMDTYEQCLSLDETERAARLRFKRDRDRFVIARGILRHLLSRYLETSPEDVAFCYGAEGKPCVRGDGVAEEFQFNLSHSEDMVLYAVTRGRAVGVDIERIRPAVADERIARRFFAPPETKALSALPADPRRRAFFELWTCKEALMKATGKGFSLRPAEFEVAFQSGSMDTTLNIPGNPGEAARWIIQRVPFGNEYAAALATEGSCAQSTHWTWRQEYPEKHG